MFLNGGRDVCTYACMHACLSVSSMHVGSQAKVMHVMWEIYEIYVMCIMYEMYVIHEMCVMFFKMHM